MGPTPFRIELGNAIATGGGGGGPVVPVISGDVLVGSSATLVQGTGPFTLVRGGVDDPVEVARSAAQVAAYAFTAADIGPTIVWRGAAGDSNALRFDDLADLSPALLLDERGLVLEATVNIRSQADQSAPALGAFTAPLDVNRPLDGRNILGVSAVDYDGFASTLVSTATLADVSTGGNAEVMAAVQLDAVPGADPATYYNGGKVFASEDNNLALVAYDNGGVKLALGAYGPSGAPTLNAVERAATVNIPQIVDARKAGAAVYLSINGVAEGASAAVGATFNTTAGLLRTGYAGAGAVLNGLIGTIVAWTATQSAAIRATAVAFLAWKYDATNRASTGHFKALFAGDSEIEGDFAVVGDSLGGSRVWALAIARAAGISVRAVGPYNLYGLHRGVGGETAQTVANAGLATWQALITSEAPNLVVLSWAINDIAAGRTSVQVLADLSTIHAAALAIAPTATFLVETAIKPGAGAAGGYGSNRAVCDTFNAALPAWAASRGITVIDRGTPALGADSIHPTAAGYRTVGTAEGAALVAALS